MDVSEGANLKGARDGLGGEGANGGFITGQVGLERALGRLPKQSPVLFQIPLRCVFGQPGREKW